MLPLSDSLTQRLGMLVPADYPVGSSAVLHPEGGPVSDDALPMLAGGGRIVAEVDVPDEDVNGVLFAPSRRCYPNCPANPEPRFHDRG